MISDRVPIHPIYFFKENFKNITYRKIKSLFDQLYIGKEMGEYPNISPQVIPTVPLTITMCSMGTYLECCNRKRTQLLLETIYISTYVTGQ